MEVEVRSVCIFYFSWVIRGEMWFESSVLNLFLRILRWMVFLGVIIMESRFEFSGVSFDRSLGWRRGSGRGTMCG